MEKFLTLVFTHFLRTYGDYLSFYDGLAVHESDSYSHNGKMDVCVKDGTKNE